MIRYFLTYLYNNIFCIHEGKAAGLIVLVYMMSVSLDSKIYLRF
ncbi:hypothetical protein [Helicobacter trogontum]|nr:hypothetical protein [Helicobacter trogontum]